VLQAGLVLAGVVILVAVARSQLRRRYLRQLAEVERRHDLERERARIARYIHDDLGARLTQIGFWSALAADETSSDGGLESLHGRMLTIRDQSLELVRSLDEIVWAVNPKNDAVPLLVAYLCQYAAEFLSETPIRCRMAIADDLPDAWLSADRRHHLFLAAKEALNNVVKHSGAGEVWLRVGVDGEGTLSIVIEDNGRGLGGGSAGPACEGLDNMRRRLEEVGGTCEIASVPGGGTRVTLAIKPPSIEGSKRGGRR
jgi:signal transduction histidine kinase